MFANIVRSVCLSRTLQPRNLRTCLPAVQHLSNKVQFNVHQEVLPSDKDIETVRKSAIQKVNNLVSQGKEGRLFAIIHVAGKQFKITAEDLIMIEGHWPPNVGDEINLEKVLLVGGMDFTLLGRPILPQGLVSVKATVVEKDLSHNKPIFYKKKRKQYTRLNFYRSHYTTLRITEIAVTGDINKPSETVQIQRTLPWA